MRNLFWRRLAIAAAVLLAVIVLVQLLQHRDRDQLTDQTSAKPTAVPAQPTATGAGTGKVAGEAAKQPPKAATENVAQARNWAVTMAEADTPEVDTTRHKDAEAGRTAQPKQTQATVTIKAKEVALGAPNILGVYPRQNINPGASVPVRVVYPDAQTGDTVIAAVADGGQINGNKPVQVLTLDTDRAAKFTFQGSREPGLFRVTLRKGLDVKTLEFWSGPQPTYVKAKRPPLPIPK
jgi:hypothetical protein